MKPLDVTETIRRIDALRREKYMSAEAVTRRLRRVEQLRRLCIELKRAAQRGTVG